MAEGKLALFYDAQAGEAAIVTFDANGDIADTWEFTGWRKTWEFVPGRLTNASVAGGAREVLLYDRPAGEAIVLKVGRRGDVQQGAIVKLRSSWELIVASNLLPPVPGGDRDQVFFYDRAAGEAALVDLGGAVNYTHTGFRTNWDLCVAGRFFRGLSPQELTGQVMLYDRAAGLVDVLGFNTDGAVKHDKVSEGFRPSYGSLIAGSFLGDGNSQVVFYDKGDGMLLCVDFVGMATKNLSGNQVLPGSDHIIAGRFFSGDQTCALIYNRTSGEAAVAAFAPAGHFKLDSHSGWRTSWDIVTTLKGTIDRDQALLYDRNAGDVTILTLGQDGFLSEKTTTNLRRTWTHIVPLGASLEPL
jgi:hypothetical protein